MKKAALFLGIIFAVVASVVSWKLVHSGPMAAAEVLPFNTLALIEAPDIPSLITHWKESELGKLISEPEIQNFLVRPRDRLLEQSGFFSSKMTLGSFTALLTKIQAGRFFAAIEPKQEASAWIMGCQFFGSKVAMQEGLLQVTQALESTLGKGQCLLLKETEHHGESITQRTYPTLTLFTAVHGTWCFASNDLEALQKTLSLCADRSLKKEALVSAPLYQKNRRELFPQADLFCYTTGPQELKNTLYFPALLREDPLLHMAEAAGASFRLVEEGVEERCFLNGNFKINEKITHSGLRFTQPTTIGFIERVTDWKRIAEQIKTNPSLPPHLSSFLASSGLDLTSLASYLKPEMTFSIDWMKGTPLPSILLTAPEADSEKIANWLDLAAPALGGSVQASDQNDLLIISMPKMNTMIQPSFASEHGTFFVATSPTIVKENSSRSATASTLAAAPSFAKNSSLYRDANEAFFYFASKEIFGRAYELARPSILMGSAFFPKAKAFIDFSRLPGAATVARHLTPIIMSQSHTDQGFLIQSKGTLSGTPLFLITKMLYQTFFPNAAATSTTAPPAGETGERAASLEESETTPAIP